MSSIDMFSRLTSETALLRTRLEALTRQASTGRRADTMGELGAEGPRSVALRGEMGRREVYERALGQAQGRAGIMQEALGRMTEIAREFRTTVTQRINPNDSRSLLGVQQQARSALSEMAHLLNTRHTGEYLFAGSDLANPPIQNADGLATGQMAQDVAAEIATLGVNDAATVLGNTRVIAQSTAPGVTPFSPRLTADETQPPGSREPRRSVPSTDGELLGFGIHANRNAEAVSTGETTGSWARDLMRGLMSVAALTPAQMADPAQFQSLVEGIRAGFASAEHAIGEEVGALGQVEERMASAQVRHERISTVLKGQLADIEEVDLAEAITRLQATRTTLEASYRAIGSLSELTLSKFLR